MKGTNTAVAIKQLQDSGAIVLGSTNISEACMWHESHNTIYGTTYNPYDFGRTAGGSSGGIGAAVSSCMAPIGVSSDVGGSTRIPALYNGLFGHKPTGGAVSNGNTFPSCGTGRLVCRSQAISALTTIFHKQRSHSKILPTGTYMSPLRRSVAVAARADAQGRRVPCAADTPQRSAN